MKSAIGILIVLTLACTAGSVIPQGKALSWYTANYSERMAGAILLFSLNDVFHCGWFVVLTIVLCLNLFGCNLIHFPRLVKRTREGFDAGKRIAGAKAETALGSCKDARAVFSSLGFRHVQELSTEDGREAFYAVKNRIGLWGAWFTHLGMLVVILGFGLGQMLKMETSVYGVPGQTKPVEGTSLALTIDDFTIDLREDETVEQYTAALTLTDTGTGESRSGECSVNAPLSLFGYKFYQNSTGWAATMEVRKEGEVIQEELLCAGEYAAVEDLPDLTVTLAAFYPDYAQDAQGRPRTASSSVVNPGYLYRIYYKEQVLGMNVLTGEEVINVESYTIRFKDPQSYTLIQIKRDPFTPLAAVGGLTVLLALFVAFYLRTAELWAVRGTDGLYLVWGTSKKGGVEFADTVRQKLEPAEGQDEM